MMNTLLESKRIRGPQAGGALPSIAFHSAVVFFAIFATARAGTTEPRENRQQRLTYVAPTRSAQPRAARMQQRPPTAATMPAVAIPRVAMPSAPIEVPIELPKIDHVAPMMREDFARGGAGSGGLGRREGTSVDGGDPNATYSGTQVDGQVRLLSGMTRPTYPAALRASGTEGEAIVEFVVTEHGRVDLSTFRVISATNELFVASIRKSLMSMRFEPARLGGHSVRQIVQQAFVFKLDGR